MKLDKKQQILIAATKKMAQKGFHGTTISDIANESKVAEGLIYHYFVNKEDILLSIFLSFWQNFNKKIEEIFYFQEDENPAKKLKIVLKILKNNLAKDQNSLYLVKVLHESLPVYFFKKSDEKNEELIKKRKQITLENRKLLFLLDNIIKQGSKDKKNNPKVIRQGLYGAFQMLLYGLFLKGSGREKNIGYSIKEAEKFINQLIDFFIK